MIRQLVVFLNFLDAFFNLAGCPSRVALANHSLKIFAHLLRGSVARQLWAAVKWIIERLPSREIDLMTRENLLDALAILFAGKRTIFVEVFRKPG